MNAVTTIVTRSHVSWALALNESLFEYDNTIFSFILITDIDTYESPFIGDFPNLKIIYLSDIKNQLWFSEIFEKYKSKSDFLRWSLKPVLINYLLLQGYENVMFCDCDVYFFNDFKFIWKELESANVLLTPHWFDHNEPQNIHDLHTTGIINGGFLVVNKNGQDAMNWWAKMCLNKCDSKFGTINVDQGYLEMLPFFFEGIKILMHKGLNVSYWSNSWLKRVVKNDRFFVFDGHETFPLIFYHFAANKYLQFITKEKTWNGVLETLNRSLKKFGYKKNLFLIASLQLENKHISFKQRFRNKLVMLIPIRFYRIR